MELGAAIELTRGAWRLRGIGWTAADLVTSLSTLASSSGTTARNPAGCKCAWSAGGCPILH